MPCNAANRDATLPQDGQFCGLTTGRRFCTFVHYGVLCREAALLFLNSKTPVSYSGFLTRELATGETEDTEARRASPNTVELRSANGSLSVWERVRVRVFACSDRPDTLTPALSQRDRGFN